MKSPWIAFVVVAGALPVLAATTPAKPVWQWTVDERLAARFDEAARTQRVDDYLAQRALRNPQSAARSAPMMPRPVDVVHGTKHPELLLPHEIFTTFTRAAFEREDDTAAAIRMDAARRAVPLKLPADFLVSWRTLADRFIVLQREELQLRRTLYSGTSRNSARDAARLRDLGPLECRSRAEAMNALRAKFGTRFDQFLYEVAAPNVFRDIYEPVSVQQLRAEEEGCR
jgi:hypothetical protein